MAGSADKELRLKLLADDKTGRGTKSAAKNLDDVADAADDATKSTKDLGAASDAASRRIEGMDARIKTVQQNLVFLHEAMGDASDEAERMDLAKGIRKAEGEIKRLTKSRDVLKDLLPDPEPVARNFAVRLGSGIASGTTGIAAKVGGSVGPTIGIAVAAAAAPVLLSTLSTALAGGAAAGVIGAGIALAIKGDKNLANAGKLLGVQFVEGLAQTAKNALGYQVPLIFGNLEAAGQRLTAKLGKAFTQLSPYIKPFIKDVTAAAEAVGGALIGAAGRSGPALMAMGTAIRTVGDGFADAISIIADGGPEMAQNIVLVSGAIADLVRITATSIRTTAAFADIVGGVPLALLKRHYNDVAKGQKEVADSAPYATQGIADLSEEAKKATPPLRDGAEALKEYAANSQSMWDSTTRAAQAVDDVNKAFKENGKTLSENTTKGRANRDALSNLASAYNATYESSLKTNGEGPKTDAIARSNTRNFIILAQRLGATKKQAIELADQMLAIPDVTRHVRVTGLSQAKRTAQLINDTLASIKNRTVNVTVRSGKNSSELRAAYEKNARERGGPVKANHAYVVGEKRAEVFVPNQSGHIVPSIDEYMRAGNPATRWAGGGQRGQSGGALTVRVVGGGGANDWLWQAVNYGFRNGLISVTPG